LAVNENNIYTIMKEGGVKLCIGIISAFGNNEKVHLTSAPLIGFR